MGVECFGRFGFRLSVVVAGPQLRFQSFNLGHEVFWEFLAQEVVVVVVVVVVVAVGSWCVCRRARWCDSFAGMC